MPLLNLAAKTSLDYKFRRKLNEIQGRCNCSTYSSYKNYGGRGIKCFLRWQDLKYLWERDNADSMKQPSIDRIDSNGHYALENCRFIELKENILRGRATKRHIIICNMCGKSHQTRYPWTRWCSSLCAWRFHGELKRRRMGARKRNLSNPRFVKMEAA